MLRKMIKIVRFKAKCTKIDLGWGSAPDAAGRAYSAPPSLLTGINGNYF